MNLLPLDTNPIIAIERLNADYCDAVLRRDAPDWGALWTEDSRWFFLGEWLEGNAAIVARWSAAMAGFPVVLHKIISQQIDPQGDTGTGRVYLEEEIVTADGDALRFVGVYHDRYQLSGDRWRYASRRFDLMYQGPGAIKADGWIGYPSNVIC